MQKLLIVESPAKAKTIGKYLGAEFVVLPSVGHVRDLPKRGLSIKITPTGNAQDHWTFLPAYEISAEKKKIVTELKRAAKKADEIYLAPDPDREGEAIAWHLREVLRDAVKDKPMHRVTYNEITKSAVREAVANPGEINMARVDAQAARRILDRLVGFKVSPMLWRNLSYGFTLSAGRVQSVALRLIAEREAEIKAFVPEKYWLMGVEARKESDKQGANIFQARLARLDGKKPEIKTDESSAMIVRDLDGASLRVAAVNDTNKKRHPYPPFTTSTLQQAASSVCGYTPHRTMGLAQKLYEEGLITYMRTDSVNIAQVARTAAAELIANDYGKEFLPATPNFYKSKGGAQEAHEAIRPTDVTVRPGSSELAAFSLDASSQKLYALIWRRFVASQMADAQLVQKTISIEPVKDSLYHSYLFTASTTAVKFEGFLRVMETSLIKKDKENADGEDDDEVKSLPPLTVGEKLEAVRWLPEQRETKPPARFSEASLVKALEDNGVGRPSTYAQTIEVLKHRQYAALEAKQLVPTQRGLDVNDWLVKNMPELFNVGYTAEMEAELDKIEDGNENCNEMLSGFYKKFTLWLEEAQPPPPPQEKFKEVFALLDHVKVWKEPVGEGRRVYDDHGFVESLRAKLNDPKFVLTDKQLNALVKIAVTYRDQIPNGEFTLTDMGYGAELERVKNAPTKEMVKWCFETIDRIGGLGNNPFLNSLRDQVDRGRLLSAKQFSILARSVGENAGSLEDVDKVRERLAPYVPGGFKVAESDPTVAGVFELLESVKAWKDPVRRGRKMYNDEEFVSSLRDQFRRRSVLSPRQVTALKHLCIAYREQIPTFAANAERLGLTEPPRAEGEPSRPPLRRRNTRKTAK